MEFKSLDNIHIFENTTLLRKMIISFSLGLLCAIIGLFIISMPFYLSLVLLLSPMLLILVILYPLAGLIGYVIGLSLTRFQLFGFDIAYSPGADTINFHQLFLLLAFLGWFVNLVVKRESSLKFSFIDVPTFFLIGYTLLAIIWAPSLKISLLTFAKIIANILAFFLIIQLVDSEKKLKILLGAFILTGIVSVLFVIFTTKGLLGGPLGLAIGEKIGIIRVYGLMENTEGLAALLTQSFFVSLGVMYSLKSIGKKIFLSVACTLMFFCLFLTFSRGWLIGFFAGLLFFMFKKGNIKTFFLFLSILIIVLIVFQLSGEILEKFLYRFAIGEEYYSTEDPRFGRIALYKGALHLFFESYGLGVGLGGFPALIGDIFPEKAGKYTHSLYLTILVELGVMGTIIFLWWISILVRRIIKASKAAEKSLYENIYLGWCGGIISFGLNGFIRLSLAHNWWTYVALGIVMMSVGLKMGNSTTFTTSRETHKY
jgi:O-antigen ligase